MKKFLFSNWTSRLMALFFTIVLFAYVQGTNSSTSPNSNNRIIQLSSNKAETFSVPLSLTVNSNRYFVNGYPEKVRIHLSGPSALVTTTANTQNFKAFADLSKLSVGRHTVRIQQEGLNSELKYRFAPETITVDIQPRKTVTYPLNVNYSKDNIAPGYQTGKASADVKNVKITGASDEINKINRVAAQLNVPQNAKTSINSQAIIEALDKNNNTVNVVITPATADVNLPITPGNSKEVPVSLKSKGITDQTDQFNLSTPTKRVEVFGSVKQLQKLRRVEVEVDTSDVSNTKTKQVTLDPKLNGVKGFNPSKISVKITRK
ncbi:YbbR-like domain-containing protein [Lentilactobacillus sp. SPB1-3]|uniref:YbbR-like domain-containing protein n=1 Tax=Lentilactobacillus terminaliae TaxID=3003483 RepID=A0ACD5DGM6_9LACO|nr:CdaR family protein [Lentilactobacillus sp. SPB1-3]MCZ0976991.1 CdaR family protein [Lentilactobacillus sp. SPB1-3]